MRSWFKRKSKGEGAPTTEGEAPADGAPEAADDEGLVVAGDEDEGLLVAGEADESDDAEPVEASGDDPDSASDGADASGSEGTAVVVEDDPDAAEVTARMLRQLGWHAIPMPSAEQALRHMRGWTPDLLLIDLHLKGMDGFGLLDRARNEVADFDNLRILAISGVYTDSTRLRVQLVRRGVSRLVPKPFSSAQLAAAIEAAGPAGDLEDWSWKPSESGTFQIAPTGEQEREVRYRCRAEALVFGTGGAEQCVLAELSRGGCRVVAERFPWAATDEVRIRPRFDLPGRDEPIRPTLECEVVWARELLPTVQEVGLRVLRCQPGEALDLLLEHLASEQQESWPEGT